MPNLVSLQGKNVVTYDSFFLPLDLKGVTTIRGRNLDTKQSEDSNSCGKSLLAATIHNVLYFEPPTAVKRNSAKGIYRKDGWATLTIDNNGDLFRINQSLKGSSVRYEITKNDSPLEIHTTASVKEYIGSIFPLTIDQYCSTVYLNAFTGSTLLKGSGSSRMGLFENLFMLQAHESMKDLVKTELDNSKTALASLATLSEELENMGEIEDASRLETRLKKLKRSLEKLHSTNDSLLRKMVKLENLESLFEQIPKGSSSKEDLLSFMPELKAKKDSLEKALRKGDKVNLLWATYRAQKEKKSRLLKKLEALPEVKIDKDFDYDSTFSKAKELISKVKEYTEHKDTIEDFVALKWFKPSLTEDFFESIREERSSKKAELSSLLRHQRFHKEGKKVCDECGSVIKSQDRKARLKDLSSRIKELEARVSKLDSMLSRYPDFKVWFRFKGFDYEASRAKALKLKEKISSYKENKEILSERTNLKRAIDDIELEKPDEPELDIKSLETKIDKLEKELELHKSQLNLYDQIEKLDGTSPEECRVQLDSLVKKKESLANKIKSIQVKVSELDRRVSLAQESSKRRLDLKKKISDLEVISEKHDVYTILQDAYGPRGLLTFVIKQLADHYADNLNKVSTQFFSKPVKFYIELKGRDLGVIAERNRGMGSDARELSGFEGRAFSLASLVSLLPLLSNQYRTNLIILDELESGLSFPNRNRFAHELLPMVAEYIPSVYVITSFSQKEFYVPDSKEVNVILEKGKSRIEGI